MADNKRWVKVWTSLLTDLNFLDLHCDIVGAWVRLLAVVAEQGEKGSIKLPRKHFLRFVHLEAASPDEINRFIAELKRINVDIFLCNDCFSVTFKKWHKYQVDNSTERTANWRKNVTVQEEKRREEKRKEKNNTFDVFYSSYPRKVNKPRALKAWQKIDPSEETTKAIMEGLERWKKSKGWIKENGQYIPHPATWLNGRGWEDAIPEGEELWR